MLGTGGDLAARRALELYDQTIALQQGVPYEEEIETARAAAMNALADAGGVERSLRRLAGAHAPGRPRLRRGGPRGRPLAGRRRDLRLHRGARARPRQHRCEVRPRTAAPPRQVPVVDLQPRPHPRADLRFDRPPRPGRCRRAAAPARPAPRRDTGTDDIPDAARRARGTRGADPARGARRRPWQGGGGAQRARPDARRRAARWRAARRASPRSRCSGSQPPSPRSPMWSPGEPARTSRCCSCSTPRARWPPRPRRTHRPGSGAPRRRRRGCAPRSRPCPPASPRFTDRVLPDLLPVTDVAAFDACSRGAVAIESPPPVETLGVRVTNYLALEDIGSGNYFDSGVTRRVVVLLTDGESLPFDPRQVAAQLLASRRLPLPRDPLLGSRRGCLRRERPTGARVPPLPGREGAPRPARGGPRRALLRGGRPRRGRRLPAPDRRQRANGEHTAAGGECAYARAVRGRPRGPAAGARAGSRARGPAPPARAAAGHAGRRRTRRGSVRAE